MTQNLWLIGYDYDSWVMSHNVLVILMIHKLTQSLFFQKKLQKLLAENYSTLVSYTFSVEKEETNTTEANGQMVIESILLVLWQWNHFLFFARVIKKRGSSIEAPFRTNINHSKPLLSLNGQSDHVWSWLFPCNTFGLISPAQTEEFS